MWMVVHVEDVAEAFVRVALADTTRYTLYNTGGTPISLGDLADMVREFLPDARISFDAEGGREDSNSFLVDNSRLREEFELEYPPLRTRILETINDVRRGAGLPLIA
jgi:nucleoside-diphosphate-sugar epimerase